VEIALYLLTVALSAVLLRPVLRRLPVPAWLARARARGRPGVPVTAWLATALVLLLAWAIGERRGLAGVVLLALWIVTPVAAGWIMSLWIRRSEARGTHG